MRASINKDKIIIISDTVNDGFPEYFRRLKTRKVFSNQRLPLACDEAVINRCWNDINARNNSGADNRFSKCFSIQII